MDDRAIISSTALRRVAICESEFPLGIIPQQGDYALAVITGIEGPSYRPLGAMMLVDTEGTRRGSLSSGCLERDVALRALQAMRSGQPQTLRYGRGSPYFDIELPCGGGLEITVIPNPCRILLSRAAAKLAKREKARLILGADGRLAQTGCSGTAITILPQLRFLVFGKGPEAACFATLARHAGYPAELYAPDPETLEAAGFGQMAAAWPIDAAIDDRTAITLFFHEHAKEAKLLQNALSSRAFYIGAQGSLRAHQARCAELAASGMSQDRIARLASPFGLIPSTRDARTLAVSVLAHVLDRARQIAAG